MDVFYDPERVARAFDEYGDREWSRHEDKPFSRVAFHVHRHYLSAYVRAGDGVLEAGAGAGRYTVELARLGARVTVIDISRGQLELNGDHVHAAGLEQSVERREIANIVDLSRFADGSFEAVVCYGGALSFVVERADAALAELLRVTRRGGYLLLSVMCNLGSLRAFLPVFAEEIVAFGLEAGQAVFDTGNLPDHQSTLGPMRMYTWDGLRSLLERHPCEVVVASAANFLSVGNDQIAESWLQDSSMWDLFLDWELRACAQPGALDAGTHIIAVVRAV